MNKRDKYAQSVPMCAAGARPIARRAAGARVLATAAPLQHAAASNGNGAVQQPAVQQVEVTQPVAVAAPVQIMGVIPPAAVYQAVSGSLQLEWVGRPSSANWTHVCTDQLMVEAGCVGWQALAAHPCRRNLSRALPRPTWLPPAPAANPPQAATAGAAKAAMPFTKTVMLGIVAGAYVGLCAALLMTGEGRRGLHSVECRWVGRNGAGWKEGRGRQPPTPALSAGVREGVGRGWEGWGASASFSHTCPTAAPHCRSLQLARTARASLRRTRVWPSTSPPQLGSLSCS